VNGAEVSVSWSWHSIGSRDNHVPERFTPIRFSTTCIEDLPMLR
jgi:hypothetical protein